MRTHTLTIRDQKYMIVDLPEGAMKVTIHRYPRSGTWLIDASSKELNAWKVKLENGRYEVIALIRDLTEEQAGKIVGDSPFCLSSNKNWTFSSALESLLSKLSNEGVMLSNPMGVMPREAYEITAYGLRTRCYDLEKDIYGCMECCNGDRCNEDCTAVYKGRRKACPHCKGKGSIKVEDATEIIARDDWQAAEDKVWINPVLIEIVE
jgi:hypothetical protein